MDGSGKESNKPSSQNGGIVVEELIINGNSHEMATLKPPPNIGRLSQRSLDDNSIAKETDSTIKELSTDGIESFASIEEANPPTVQAVEGALTRSLVLAVLALVIGCSFQFGYHIGCINSSKDLIEKFIQETSFADSPERFNAIHSWIWASIVSAFPFGAIFGSIIAGKLADKYGRRTTIYFNNIPAAIAGALMTFAYPFKMWYLLLIGRFIIGVNAGISSGVITTFLTEISPDNLRGTLGSCNQLFLTAAILFSNILSFKTIFGTETRWQYIFALTFFPIVTQLILLNFCPESPRYTLIFEGDEAQAEKDLIMLRENPDVRDEIEAIKREAAEREDEPKVTFATLFTRELRWATFIAVFLMFMQQMSGINAAMYYSNDIFQSAGLSGDYSVWASCAMMLANVVVTVASTWLVDHPLFGRRFLLLAGMAGMFLTSIAVVISLVLINNNSHVAESRVGAIIFMVLFVISFAMGPGSIPWFYVSELFASNARASATSVACAANWLTNFAIGLLFPPIQEQLTSYTFLIFTTSLFICAIITILYVPETKGKSVQEAQRDLQKRRPPCI